MSTNSKEAQELPKLIKTDTFLSEAEVHVGSASLLQSKRPTRNGGTLPSTATSEEQSTWGKMLEEISGRLWKNFF